MHIQHVKVTLQPKCKNVDNSASVWTLGKPLLMSQQVLKSVQPLFGAGYLNTFFV